MGQAMTSDYRLPSIDQRGPAIPTGAFKNNMTNNQQLGKLTSVHPRTIWPDEALDFTPWVAANLDQLSEELGLDLELEDTETKVGDFLADITATVTGRTAKVVIENQLATTDHNHLGQLLTYASGQDADIVIWVTTEFRDEHRQALDWLNQRTDDSLEFYGVTVDLKRIGNSPPAPEFRSAVSPNAPNKETRKIVSSSSNDKEKYREFFQVLADELRDKHQFGRVIKAQPRHSCSFPSGHEKIGYCAAFATKSRSRARVEVNLHRRQGDFNKHLFDALFERRGEIEEALGATLSWERMDQQKSSRIIQHTKGSINDSEQDLAKLREWMVGTLLKFKAVFEPHLK